MKIGAPTIEVTTPIGNSVGANNVLAINQQTLEIFLQKYGV